MLAITEGEMDFEDTAFMAKFDHIKPMTVEDFFRQHWAPL
jgi:hypothetical protein